MTNNGSSAESRGRWRRHRSPRHPRAILLICLAVLLSGCRGGGDVTKANGAMCTTGAAGACNYSTSFPLTENPISENGQWAGGSVAGASIRAGGKIWRGGRLWGNVQTTPGLAFGVDEPTAFGDPTAILAGTWEPNQMAMATVAINKTPTNKCCHEVELRLRTTISKNKITGYEAYCSVMPNEQYCHIARWNGPNGSYWNFETGKGDTYLKDGDVMKATVTGANPTIVTLYKNGVQILEARDTGAAGGGFGAYGPWLSGNPGIGFFDNYDSDWNDFGLSWFSATDDPRKLNR